MKQFIALLSVLILATPAFSQVISWRAINYQFTSNNSTLGINPTALTNIAQSQVTSLPADLAAKAGKTNQTFYQGSNAAPAIVISTNGGDAMLRIGDFLITATGQSLVFNDLTGPVEIFSFTADTFTVQEKVSISEQLTVTTGQDGPAIYQSGGGTNFFDASTYFQSNVYVRSLTASNATPSRVATFNAANQITNVATTGPLLGTGLVAAGTDIAGVFTGSGDYLKSDGSKGTPAGGYASSSTGAVTITTARLLFTNWNYSKVFGAISALTTNTTFTITNAGDYRIQFGTRLTTTGSSDTLSVRLVTNDVVCTLMSLGFASNAQVKEETGFKSLVLALPANCRVGLNVTNDIPASTTTVNNILLDIQGTN